MTTPSTLHCGLHSFSRRTAFQDPDYTEFSFLDEAAELGFRSVELMTGKAGSPPEHLSADDPAHLRKVVAYARERGVAVHCFSTYNDFAFTPNEAWRLANIDYILDWIGKAAEVEVPNLRLLTGYLVDGEPLEKLEQLVVDGIAVCLEKAESLGVNLALENHSAVFLYADAINALRTQLASPRLTTCPDPTNGFDRDRLDELATQEAIMANLAALAPAATNAHLKIFGVADGKLVTQDLDRLIRTLAEARYRGPLMFELTDPEGGLELLRAAKMIVDDALDRLLAPNAPA